MRDLDDEVREIKKEIIESRGLIIKTNNLVNALGADVKAIAKRQAGYERRFNWNSGFVYAIIAGLCFFGLKLAFDARVREAHSETAALEAELKTLKSELGDEVRRSSDRTAVAAKAARLYELIQAKKRVEAIEAYEALPKDSLSPAEAAFFRDVEREFRSDLSMQAYQKGLEQVRVGKHKEAAASFREAVELRSEGAHIPAVQFNLAKTLRRLGRSDEALVLAKQVAEQSLDPALQPDGWWLLAACARDGDDLDTARSALKMLIKKYPRSALSRDARPLLRELTREAYLGKKATAGGPTQASNSGEQVSAAR